MSIDPLQRDVSPQRDPAAPVWADPRVRRTRRALQEALSALVDEHAPISMSSVAHRAGVSRQALHTHYDSLERLACEVLARRLLEGTGHEAPADAELAEQDLVDAVRRDGLALFLRFIREDTHAFLTLRRLAHGQTTAVLARVFAGLADGLVPSTAARPRGRVAALFIAGGMTTLVDEWLHGQAAASPEQLSEQLDHLARAVFAEDERQDHDGPERWTS